MFLLVCGIVLLVARGAEPLAVLHFDMDWQVERPEAFNKYTSVDVSVNNPPQLVLAQLGPRPDITFDEYNQDLPKEWQSVYAHTGDFELVWLGKSFAGSRFAQRLAILVWVHPAVSAGW